MIRTCTACLCVMAVLASCWPADTTITGSGRLTREERTVQPFSGVVLTGSGHLFITRADKPALTIEAEDNIIEHLSSEVHDGTLTLGRHWTDENNGNLRIHHREPINYYLNVTDLAQISVAGSGSIESTEPIVTPSLTVSIRGSGDVTLDLETIKVTTEIAGAGDARFEGTTDHQDIFISGSGDYDAPRLQSKTAHIVINGSGDVDVAVADDLDVNIAGSGTVTYRGQPAIHSQVFGSGKLVKRD